MMIGFIILCNTTFNDDVDDVDAVVEGDVGMVVVVVVDVEEDVEMVVVVDEDVIVVVVVDVDVVVAVVVGGMVSVLHFS